MLTKTLVSLMSLLMSLPAIAARGPELSFKLSFEHPQMQRYKASQRQQPLERCKPQQGSQQMPLGL